MAVDMFLKLTGIDGESADSVHAGEIDVLAWSWGATQSGSMHTGGGGGSGKVNVQDVSVTKYVDSASHVLLKHVHTGAHIDEGVLTIRKAGGSPIEYVIIKMRKIIITSVSTGGSGGEDRLTENISLNFKEFDYAYTPQLADGKGDAAKEFSFDILGNTEL
ncbi:MAG: type VI secretion system tube protein Hcp [bacterium]